MSLGMSAPLLVLAALLVFPGRMPESHGAASTVSVSAHVSTIARMTSSVSTVLHRLHVP